MKVWIILALAAVGAAKAAAVGSYRFLAIDANGLPVAASIEVSRSDGSRLTLYTMGAPTAAITMNAFDPTESVVRVLIGRPVEIRQDGPPVHEIKIVVRATRLIAAKPPAGSTGTTRSREDLTKFTNTGSGDQKGLVKGQSGVAEDSAGQAHVRGEHADISYVVDGVPLPDTLSGRQGSVVVPSTIQSLDILTGGYAPEYGGQTAAILNITTLKAIRTFRSEASLQAGSYRTLQGDATAQGPLGKRASFVFNFGANRTDLAVEPHQPGSRTAHNQGSSRSGFTNFRFKPSAKDDLSLTLSNNPDALQIANRVGLPASFASAGQGFGFLGLRNADGTRPDGTPGTLGSDPIVLDSQQKAGQDINQDEVSEFATLNYQRRFGTGSTGQLAVTLLHSGSNLYNFNPAVDVLALPVDSSIEYNPTAVRNVHHVQLTGSAEKARKGHTLKAGFLYDAQSGQESYNIIPASQLALDALAAAAPNLAPPGSNTGETDVNGNPVYHATGAPPTLHVSRSGFYGAVYAQDTWTVGHFTANYGLRGDWYHQKQSLGGAPVSDFMLAPRINLEYRVDRNTELRASYNRLLSTPPLAQGAIVGDPIQPEKISQYDLGMTHRLGHGQSVGAAYYYKDIRNQVDTGLLIPGSDIGLYSAVNLEKGAVHGLELSYNIGSAKGVGWDGYLNYSLSAAKPNGVDNTGAPVGEFNDHDQRHTIGAGLAYSWKTGMNAALTFEYGSGLASSVVPPSIARSPRHQFDFRFSSGEVLFNKRVALTLNVENLTDQRTVINFQSAFSGTRFMMGRRILIGLAGKF